jgi:hypothetical protein
MKCAGSFSWRGLVPLGLVALGFGLLRSGIRFERQVDLPEAYNYADVTIEEFAQLYLQKNLDYYIRLSEAAKRIPRRATFGAVKHYPLRKALMIASHRWGVKFYVKGREIFVCSAEEYAPADFATEPTELLFAQPLPVVANLRFSKARHMCGPNCLALLSYALGSPVSVERVAQLAGTDPSKGTTMAGLAQAAQALGFRAKGKKLSLRAYKKLRSPAIIHMTKGGGHYAVLNGYNSDNTFSVIDPPITRLFSETELEEQYTQRALFVWKP